MKAVATPHINKIVRKLIAVQADLEVALKNSRTADSHTYLEAVLFNVREATRDADFARINERGK